MLNKKRTRLLIDNIILQHESFSTLQERSYQISMETMTQFQLKL